MLATRLKYLRDGCTLSGTSQILGFSLIPAISQVNGAEEPESNKTVTRATAILDATWFYPAGGGQPSDVGTLEERREDDSTPPAWRLVVDSVRLDPATDLIRHEGAWIGSFPTNYPQPAAFQIDPQVRSLHNRLHTAGHLLDLVIFDVLGHSDLSVGKAYHYPQGPAIEYTGKIQSISGNGKDALAAKAALVERIQRECNSLIEKDLAVAITFDPATAPDDDKAKRYMSVQTFPRLIPCGGTHCETLCQVGKMIIRKIEMKGNITRVAYGVA